MDWYSANYGMYEFEMCFVKDCCGHGLSFCLAHASLKPRGSSILKLTATAPYRSMFRVYKQYGPG